MARASLGHSLGFTACSWGSLCTGKEGLGSKPNGHSPEPSQREGTSPVRGTARAAWCFQKQRVPKAEVMFFQKELSSDFSLAFSYYICSVRAVFRPFSVCSGRSPVISEWVWGRGNKYFYIKLKPKKLNLKIYNSPLEASGTEGFPWAWR